MPLLSETLAHWVAALRWQDVPQPVREACRLQVLDVIGVMLAARPTSEVQAAEAAMRGTDAGPHAALGGQAGLSLAGAAFVNGVMSSVLEFDDTHIASFVHPSVTPVSALLAVAGQHPLSGAALMQAMLVGSELSCRLGLVTPVRLHGLGIHPTAVMGIFGAVYALARCHALPPAITVSAIGHAASMCGGLMASWEDGSATKTLHVGMGASQAVRAVALARAGIAGPASALDGRFGWFRTHVQSVAPAEFRFEAAAHGLGQDWELLNVASKPYPSAFTIHPYVDAVLALRSKHGIAPEAIAEIRCVIAKSSVATLCEPLAEKLRPLTSWQGRISLQHSMAEALVLGYMDKTAYSAQALSDPRIQALADKVRYAVDPQAPVIAGKAGARVWIRMAGGQEFHCEIDNVRGTRDNPISPQDYVAKFRANADGVVPPARVDEALAMLEELEELDDIAPLLAGLAS